MILQILLLVAVLALVVMLISAIVGVPFLPTHRRQARLMMELGQIGPGKKVVDLGSGAGRLLFLAAKAGAIADGYELNPILYVWTQLVILLGGYRGRVRVHFQSLYQAPVGEKDVVFAFLFPEPMRRLGPKLFAELKPGARIVSYTFSIPNKTPLEKREGVYVYMV